MRGHRGLLAIILLVMCVGIARLEPASTLTPHRALPLHATSSTSATKGQYWFQVGAWASSNSGYGDNFGYSVTGASVEIRILSNQRLIHLHEDLSYWIGINLPNDAFIQVGYAANLDHYDGRPSWFWEYFPPGTAEEASAGFLGDLGPVVGSNGTWNRFRLESSGTIWSAYVNQQLVGSIDLKVSNSGTNGPYASAEIAGTRDLDNVLGPVEFRNLAYRDLDGAWREADAAVALCCYGAGSDKLPTGTPPYGVAGYPGENNHWIAGSGIAPVAEGDYLWPWYYVNVSSQLGGASGSGWYVKGTSIYPSAPEQIPVNQSQRLVLTGWVQNGVATTSSSFSAYYNMSLSALYTTQFQVTISSLFGRAHGSGWYNAGENATIWVDPTSIRADGWLGVLGVRNNFVGWAGDYSKPPSADGKSHIIVDGPKSINAVWKTDYGFIPEIGLVGVAAILAGIFLTRTKVHRAKLRTSGLRHLHDLRKEQCRFCESEIPLDSIYCSECGRKII